MSFSSRFMRWFHCFANSWKKNTRFFITYSNTLASGKAVTQIATIFNILKMEVPDWQGGNLFLGVALQVATLLHQIITTFSIFLVKKVLLCTHLYIDPNWTRISNFFCSFCYKMINDIEDCVSGQYLRGSQAFISAAFFLTLLFEFLKSHHLSKQRTVRSVFFTEIDLALLLLHSSERRQIHWLSKLLFLRDFWELFKIMFAKQRSRHKVWTRLNVDSNLSYSFPF